MKSIRKTLSRWIRHAPMTIGLSAVIVALNWSVVTGAQASTDHGLVRLLEYDHDAILDGEVWRILTGNLVHWSAMQVLLDVGAFLVVGLLFERNLRRFYPAMLLASAAAVGLGLLVWAPEVTLYRGLSGVASGQFAVAVLWELRRSRTWGERLLPLGAFALLAAKLSYEAATGELFFGTDGLGELGLPIPLAHVAGTVCALPFALRRDRSNAETPAPGSPCAVSP